MKRVLLGLVASLVLATPAQAFTPPELFVRTQRWDTHEESGPWLPLASAPALNYLGGYQIGYKLQDSAAANDFQTVALTIVSVPDGDPTQPNNEPFCVGRAGTPGTIVEAGPELQFEGDGTYTVKVNVGDGPAGTACLSEPSTTGSFRVPTRVTPTLFGQPMSFRAEPLPGDPFVGVKAPDPPGGQADVRCALNGHVQPDGSLAGDRTIPDPSFSHPAVIEDVFPRPGAWMCNARGTAEGRDDNLDSVRFGTPWSAPIGFEVHSDFRYLLARITRARTRRPKLTFRAEWPALAQGGRATLKLRRVTGCTRKRYKTRKAGTFRAPFGAKRAQVTVKRPRPGYYLAFFAFNGTHFLKPVRDPQPFFIFVDSRRRFQEVPQREFFACSASARAATAVNSGTIVVGRGAAGARLDMTRKQVIARLGTPESQNGNGVLSYQPDDADRIFDVYRHLDPPKHVRMFILAGFHGASWRLKDGNAIFAKRSIARLYRHYGKRVRRVTDETGNRLYVIKSRYHHRPVETQFLVDRFGRKRARVLDVFILFTDRGP